MGEIPLPGLFVVKLVSEKFSETNLTTKRPADGILPMKWKQIIGKKAKKNYKKNDFI